MLLLRPCIEVCDRSAVASPFQTLANLEGLRPWLTRLESRASSVGRPSASPLASSPRFAEDLLTGDRQLGTRGRFVMVALDAHGKATVVPGLAGS